MEKPQLNKTKTSTYTGKLSAQTELLLNKLIEAEAFSSQIYLQMAAWCGPKGYTGAEKFFRKHYLEERVHMLKHYDYFSDKNIIPTTPTIQSPQKDYMDLYDVIETALEHEYMISKTYELAGEQVMLEPCHQTYQHLQFFIKEQVEEESLFQTICDKYKILSKGGSIGLAEYMLDEYLGELA